MSSPDKPKVIVAMWNYFRRATQIHLHLFSHPRVICHRKFFLVIWTWAEAFYVVHLLKKYVFRHDDDHQHHNIHHENGMSKPLDASSLCSALYCFRWQKCRLCAFPFLLSLSLSAATNISPSFTFWLLTKFIPEKGVRVYMAMRPFQFPYSLQTDDDGE